MGIALKWSSDSEENLLSSDHWGAASDGGGELDWIFLEYFQGSCSELLANGMTIRPEERRVSGEECGKRSAQEVAVDVALKSADDDVVRLAGAEHGLGVDPGSVLRYEVDDDDSRRVG